MNRQRREIFDEMYSQAFAAYQRNDYRIVLDRERFHRPVYDFLRGEDCPHTPVLCLRVQSNGRRMYFRYCTSCCRKLTSFLPYKSLTDAEMAAARPHSDYEALYAVKMECSNQVGEFFTMLWWWAYDLYLQSEEWMARRSQVLGRDRQTCQLRMVGCTGVATQVHHLTYERVTREALEDLVSACANCHKAHHIENTFVLNPKAQP